MNKVSVMNALNDRFENCSQTIKWTASQILTHGLSVICGLTPNSNPDKPELTIDDLWMSLRSVIPIGAEPLT